MAEIKFRGKTNTTFRLGEEVGQLWEGDVLISIRPKQWQLLRYLAERPGKAIMKPELLDNIWGKDVAVTPQIIDQTLSGLRHRLGDKAKGSRFIETVSGGLKFVAKIEQPRGESQHVDQFESTGQGNDERAASTSWTERFPIKAVGEALVFKVDWKQPPYTTVNLHVDQPLFEDFPGDWFHRGKVRVDCPHFYRLLLGCPGIESVSRASSYELLLGRADLSEYAAVVRCITETLRTATGVQQVLCTEQPETNSDGTRNKESQRVVDATKYTDGDWITAAIVARERAETKLKRLAFAFGKLNVNTRSEKIDHITRTVEATIAELLEKHAQGGRTDDTRLEACIAKVVADILQSELAEFQWSAVEKSKDDPVIVFRDTIKTIASRHR
jgi:DNA-binding winged helix-turn-helix (wHTH) protein